MLKSIVNGAEHDIISIPMKGKNLFDPNSTRYHMGKASNNYIGNFSGGAMFYIKADYNTEYTIKVHTDDSTFVRLYLSNKPIVEGVAESYNVISESDTTVNPEVTISNTDYAYLWIQTGGTWYTEHGGSSIMLNAGSTALPYEPYGYQNGWEVRDNQNRIIWGREDELQTITGTLPFKGYDLPIKVKSLLGSAVQNGTPAPDNIITPEMCGVRTGNLLDFNALKSANSGTLIIPESQTSISVDNLLTINGEPNEKYTMISDGFGSTSGTADGNRSVYFQTASGTNAVFRGHPVTVTTDSTGILKIGFFPSRDNATQYLNGDSHVWLVKGNDITIPYEPYGYKIPITNVGHTTPIYLGEVPTIRRIKKLVFDGTEDWSFASSDSNRTVCKLSLPGRFIAGYCTHINWKKQGTYEEQEYNRIVYDEYLYVSLENSLLDEQTVVAFKSYLVHQYQNGTPVIIWYVLANPETGIVNEPLAKIGDYADELTTIKVHGLSAPLYGIGDYKDILNLSTGVVTRNVKKLVLTGDEEWFLYSTNYPSHFITYAISDRKQGITPYCTHYEGSTVTNYSGLKNGCISVSTTPTSNGRPRTTIHDNRFSTIIDFKSYLATQYAAGTPVTIWYVLETPETETVTVPTGMTGEVEGYLTQISTPTPEHQSIPKWNGEEETGGTYAVTVYNLPEIETTTGQNTLTVETKKIHGLTNPLCGIGDYKDVLNLSTGIIKRKIKKLVLTGEEDNWSEYPRADSSTVPYLPISNFKGASVTNLYADIICTHYDTKTQVNIQNLTNKTGIAGRTSIGIIIADESISTLADFKSYLAAQYAAGTPITVWYVIREPETETITVPYDLTCTVEGYLTRSGTPTPSNPITPDSNGILESGGTYAVEVSLVPSNLTVKGHIKLI